ncbi:PD-(D/E)XK motif protein [Roseomonas gilardii]|uniref:PD-(D/E)XK motif protein n=1 Tax=Roseomonas gilardii TaxID=257708 RepID=A0ABU3MNN7_9PROT|nr:PD-(D/E)XK motif protein [Roseomonas gilardii]MDT8333790.1 PD-(D/E)XK motif protein [Roseomonas gilardii]
MPSVPPGPSAYQRCPSQRDRANSPDAASALGISLTHIRRWKHFLSGRGSLLSPEEVRGLFAELQFLSELIARQGAAVAVAAWLGPERSHQDFIFGNTAVEIKSLAGTERSSVRISSEDQLESLNDRLFLRVYRLSIGSDGAQVLSLNRMIAQVQGLIGDPDVANAFERRLVTYGYAPLPEYDEPVFVVSETTTYDVRDGFPRMIRSRLPDGVIKIGYEIKLEAITDYKCDGEKPLEGA